MSRPKYYWYPYVQNTIRRYPAKLQKENTMQSAIAEVAIKKALQETAKKPDGAERIKLVEMVLIKQTHRIEGAADLIYVSPRTAQIWLHDFIYLVARKMGML